jgi:hypothetical protein
MPHMVIFRDAEGRPGYHQAEGIDDAVRFVEQLRNEQDVTETRIFSMQEVPIEFRTYYRVALAPPPAPAGVEAEMAPLAEPSSEPEAEAEGEPQASGESDQEVAVVGAMSDSGGSAGNGGNGGSTRFGRFRG